MSLGGASGARDVVVIGAGPAGLMAAERLAFAGHRVDIYDRMPSPARKFLMAGRGGLNLTHSEPLDAFMTRYGPARERLAGAIERMPPSALRDWAAELGQDTFVGSSGRVFPRSFKASPLLRAWLARLAERGVRLHTRHEWRGWSDRGELLFSAEGEQVAVDGSSATVLALGGASWPRLGSDGGWTSIFHEQQPNVRMVPLRAANAGVRIDWSDRVRTLAGTPVKRVAAAAGGRTVRGELVITEKGLEGGAIYALSREIRSVLDDPSSDRTLVIDLRPDIGIADLIARLSRPRGKQSASTFLRKAAGLSPPAIALLRETGSPPVDASSLAARIKGAALQLTGMQDIDRAISSSGGIAFAEIDENLMLRQRPGVFVAGEMIDWEAPTGGYLLQACFSTGCAAAAGVIEWMANREDQDVDRADKIS